MSSVPPLTKGLASDSTAYLEALEREHPELGRLEEIDGALHATGSRRWGTYIS